MICIDGVSLINRTSHPAGNGKLKDAGVEMKTVIFVAVLMAASPAMAQSGAYQRALQSPTYSDMTAPAAPATHDDFAAGYRDGREDGFFGDGYTPHHDGGSYEEGYHTGMEHSLLLDDDRDDAK